MSKKPNKSFWEYAQRWLQTASQVQPAFIEEENVTILFVLYPWHIMINLLVMKVLYLLTWFRTGNWWRMGSKLENEGSLDALWAIFWWDRGLHQEEFLQSKNRKRWKKGLVDFKPYIPISTAIWLSWSRLSYICTASFIFVIPQLCHISATSGIPFWG